MCAHNFFPRWAWSLPLSSRSYLKAKAGRVETPMSGLQEAYTSHTRHAPSQMTKAFD